MEINIEEYYTRYGPMVMRRCRQLLRDEEKALDAMQEVFTKLMISKKRLRGIYPSSLLFRISTNVCLNMIRDQRSHRSIDIRSEDLLIQLASYNEGENRLIIRDLLDRLFRKEKQSTREIATLHFVDGRGVVTLHYPESEDKDPILDQYKKTFLSTSYELDDAPDFERFFFITSKSEIDVQAILNSAKVLAKHPKTSDLAELDLPDSLSQYSLLIKKGK